MTVDELTSQERVQRLIGKRPIDRVPVFSHGVISYAAKLTGTSYKDMWTSPERSYRALSIIHDLHHFDDSPGSFGYGWSDWIIDEAGGVNQLPDSDFGIIRVVKRPVEKLSEIDKLKFPAPGEGPVSSTILKYNRLKVKNGGKAGFHAGLTRSVGCMVGNEKLLRWFYTEPFAVHALYRKITDYILATVDLYLKEFGPENCAMNESCSMDSQNVISPETYEKFSYPYAKEIHNKVVSAGVKSWYLHLCGNHTATLPLWKTLPIPARSRISIGSEMDIKKTGEYLGDYIIEGNVPTDLLQFGTYEEVLDKCRQIIEAAKDNPGGFILSSACGIPPETPPVNLVAMVNSAKLYGRYS